MDKIKKALQKLSPQEKSLVKKILLSIKANSLSSFDLKKLKNHQDIYRIRKGKLRIIFKKNNDEEYFVLAIERKSDTTYNNL